MTDCPRIELVTAIHTLASHYENALGAFGDDDEGKRKAEGDIAHAMRVAAKYNQNGPGCAAARAALAEQPAEPALPLLVRDIARELGITAVQACKALGDDGLGSYSQGMCVTPTMARALRSRFDPAPHPAPSVAVPQPPTQPEGS